MTVSAVEKRGNTPINVHPIWHWHLDVCLKDEKGEAYNIADETGDIMLRDLAALIAAQARRRVVFELSDVVEAAGFSKATKARLEGRKIKMLGWRPKYDACTGVPRCIDIARKALRK